VKYMQAWEEKYYEKEEARKEGLQKGRAEGRKEERINLVKKKLEKGKSVEEIADALEETDETIRELMKELGV
ncbi:hypothetical protein HJV72_19055, partial [Extibacter sp. GGCC_0201]|nr:hypothetical protein [Extibacter sp. GGCC_0201]